jgi:hypothetical protein
MLSPIVTTITSATTINAYQLARSQSPRVYVKTLTRLIVVLLVTVSFREILVTETEGSRKMILLKRSVLKVGGVLLCHPPRDTQARLLLAQPEEGNVIHQIASVRHRIAHAGMLMWLNDSSNSQHRSCNERTSKTQRVSLLGS